MVYRMIDGQDLLAYRFGSISLPRTRKFDGWRDPQQIPGGDLAYLLTEQARR